MIQTWLAALIVTACAVYVTWVLLLPAALRRSLAQTLLRRRWPVAVQSYLQTAARSPTGCGCDGCDAAPGKAAPPAGQPVSWTPRRRT